MWCKVLNKPFSISNIRCEVIGEILRRDSIEFFLLSLKGDGSYQDGIKFDQLPTVDEIGKEMQALPANTATRINDGVDRRDDVLYFSIWINNLFQQKYKILT